MSREFSDAPVQVAQLSMPDWGDLGNKAKALGSKALDGASALGKKAVDAAPGVANEAVKQAKHLDTPQNRALGAKALECATAGGHIGLAVCAAGGAYEKATGKELPIPAGLGHIKTTIAKKVIESATGQELPDPTHVKQHLIKEALNHPSGNDRSSQEVNNPFMKQQAPVAEGPSALNKAQSFAERMLGKAHDHLPSLTLDHSDNTAKK